MFLFRSTVFALVKMAVDALHHERTVDALNLAHDLAAQLAAERAVTVELRTALARTQANFDWLCTRVNELTIERGELYRRIGILVPEPQIELRQPAPIAASPLAGATDAYLPPAGRGPVNIGDVLAKAREIQDQATRGTPPPMPTEISFEDVGDDVAKAIGAVHDTEGRLAYTR